MFLNFNVKASSAASDSFPSSKPSAANQYESKKAITVLYNKIERELAGIF